MPEINPYEPSNTPASNEDVDLASIDSQSEEHRLWPTSILVPLVVGVVTLLSAYPGFLAFQWFPYTFKYSMTYSVLLGLTVFLAPPMITLAFMCRWAYRRWQAQARVRRLINNSSSDTDAQHEED